MLVYTPAPAFASDFTCRGNDDNIELQAALDALPASGGTISLSAGTFNLSATVSRNIDNVIIEGAGSSTILNYDGVHPIFSAGLQSNWVFRNLRTDEGGIELTAANKWILDNVTIGPVLYQFQWADFVNIDAGSPYPITPSGNNDQLLISRAIANGHRNLVLGAGVFDIRGDIRLVSNMKIIGMGNTTILNLTNAQIIISDISNIEIGSFQILGSSESAGSIYIFASSRDCTNFYVHDIENHAKGTTDFSIYVAANSAANRQISDVVFAKCSANSPDGFGFLNSGEGDHPVLDNVTYYKCTVENAGVTPSRLNIWVTAFDFVEYANMHLSNMVAIDCLGKGAWESVFHFEVEPTKSNCVLIQCEAAYGGMKSPSPVYGYGFLMIGDIRVYNGYAHNNVGDGFLTNFSGTLNREELINCISKDNADPDFTNLQYRFTVNASYVPPTLNTIGSKIIDEGETLTFSISAANSDKAPVTFSASNLPPGASFNASLHTFTWTPTYSQTGSYPKVRFQVTDGVYTAFEDITITVNNVDLSPVLSALGSKTINEGVLLTFTLLGSDADGDALTYSATNLPSGASFNAATRVFSWTPGFTQAGTYSNVHFQVTDGSLVISEDITITVYNVNRSPVLSAIGNKTVNEGVLLTFTLSGSDPDGDMLTYSATNLPSGATFNAATRVFSWTPGFAQAGTYSNVHFQVTDGSLVIAEDITITVMHTDAPVKSQTGRQIAGLIISVIAFFVISFLLIYIIPAEFKKYFPKSKDKNKVVLFGIIALLSWFSLLGCIILLVISVL